MDSEILAEESEKLKESEKERETEISRLFYVYREVFKTQIGREVIMDLLDKCGVFRTVMTGNSYTFLNEGRRQVGLYMLGFLDIPGFEPLNMNKKK